MRGAFADIGALPVSDIEMPSDLDKRFVGMFCGRFAGNLDMMRFIGDQMPGSSGEALEEQYFASARPGEAKPSRIGRLPWVIAKLPVSAWRAQREIRRMQEPMAAWWQATIADGSTTSLAEAQAALRESRSRVQSIVRKHTVNSMLSQGLFEQVRRLCASSEMAGLELSLVSADTDVHETAMLQSLWEVAHGARGLDDFLGNHGFHGPEEGQIHGRSWREDPAPLEALLAGYRRSGEAPTTDRPQQAAARRLAETQLLSSLSRVGRLRARTTLRLARHFIPLRQVGRSNFLRAYDVARCMARRIGDELTSAGMLADPEDVFYLTLEEALGDLPPDPQATVADRRATRDAYLDMQVPESWIGPCVPTPIADQAARLEGDDTPIIGVAASPGLIEGRAVVVLDPADAADLCDGDILVCQTTDPSWASLFFLVDACVIDTGGPMSHGAIVARELGIPCVIGTRDGTRRLRTGDKVRVDGTQGTVHII